MIILNLQCTEAHPFEGWFDSTDDFDRQVQSAMVACPMCGDTQVSRLPSGPRVKRANDVVEPGQQAMTKMIQALSELAHNSEDVAERFPEEARRMHYGEAEPRNIRGQASLTETRELLEEGIAIMPVPLPAKKDIH